MKSETTIHVGSLVKVYDGIFADAVLAFPSLGSSLEYDRLRLRDQIQRHGLKVASLWLPDLDKAFLKGLDGIHLNTQGLPLGRSRGCERVPLFLNGLFKMVFDPCTGRVLDDASINAITFIHQILLVGKKLRSKVDERIVQQTVASFVATDSALPQALTGLWSDPCSELSDGSLGLLQIPELGFGRKCDTRPEFGRLCAAVTLQLVFDRVATSCPLVDWEGMRPKHGPGAVSDLNRKTTSKYDLTWNRQLESMLPCTEFIATSGVDLNYDLPLISDVVAASKLCAVPKTAKGPRLIASEPAANMFMQQALKAVFDQAISQTWLGRSLDLHDQEPNRKKAVQASRDGSFATVDLSEASDRVSCAIVEAAFRRHPQLLRLLAACRTQDVNFASFGGVGRFPVKKYASMGNATTFPVESLIFLSCAYSAVVLKTAEPLFAEMKRACEGTAQLHAFSDATPYDVLLSEAAVIRRTISEQLGSSMRKAGFQVRVFGDDVIVPSDCLGYLTDVFSLLGFKINTDKTFSGVTIVNQVVDGVQTPVNLGGFRESCGVDAFRGYNITPVKPTFVFDASGLKRPKDVSGKSIESLVSLVAFSNNLHKAGFWKTAQVVSDQLLPAFTRRVCRDVPLGLFSFANGISPTSLRWDEDLQRREVKVLSVVTESDRVRAKCGRANLIQLAVEQPALLHDWSGGFDADPKSRLVWTWKAI